MDRDRNFSVGFEADWGDWLLESKEEFFARELLQPRLLFLFLVWIQ